MAASNQLLFESLRTKHKYFVYNGFILTCSDDVATVVFHFEGDELPDMRPTLSIPINNPRQKQLLKSEAMQSLLFHVGMVELVSYWKAACPPEVIVKGYSLSEKQISWFKKLFFHGLGEFFHLNGITTDIDNFMHIRSEGGGPNILHSFDVNNDVLIPIGGGKDSVVTLELAKDLFDGYYGFMLNPRGANKQCLEVSNTPDNKIISFNRSIDTNLLDLNKKGYLNGHTPFSALLAFITLIAAALNQTKYIALSNEASANEPTVGEANHQYSKSFEFEHDFRTYVHEYLTHDIVYFSFLRPLSELQIAMLFSGFKQYHAVFKSCNAGSKTDSWCGHCSKCLFAYTILSPFIEETQLQTIFGRDLFNAEDMLLYMQQLTGIADEKPFECIGTIEEVNVALCAYIKKYNRTEQPYIIREYMKSQPYRLHKDIVLKHFLSEFDTTHALEPHWFERLKNKIHERLAAQ